MVGGWLPKKIGWIQGFFSENFYWVQIADLFKGTHFCCLLKCLVFSDLLSCTPKSARGHSNLLGCFIGLRNRTERKVHTPSGPSMTFPSSGSVLIGCDPFFQGRTGRRVHAPQIPTPLPPQTPTPVTSGSGSAGAPFQPGRSRASGLWGHSDRCLQYGACSCCCFMFLSGELKILGYPSP